MYFALNNTLTTKQQSWLLPYKPPYILIYFDSTINWPDSYLNNLPD